MEHIDGMTYEMRVKRANRRYQLELQSLKKSNARLDATNEILSGVIKFLGVVTVFNMIYHYDKILKLIGL